jgi:hypothetical protein
MDANGRDVVNSVMREVEAEIDRAFAYLPKGFDMINTKNDWVAYVNAYVGRAADKCFRNEREKQDFRTNMIKAAGLAVMAVLASDKGWC